MDAITRKKNTGEPGNPGQFGTVTKAGSGIDLEQDEPRPTYSTFRDALWAEVLSPIEASGDVLNARVEYDVDAIAEKVLGGHEDGYASTVDTDTFWSVVAEHARPEHEVGLRRLDYFTFEHEDVDPEQEFVRRDEVAELLARTAHDAWEAGRASASVDGAALNPFPVSEP